MKILSAKESNQYILLNSIHNFWAFSDWHVILYINKFLFHKSLKYTPLLNWTFKNIEKNNENFFQNNLYWKILNSLLEKMLNKLEYSKEETEKVNFIYSLLWN